MEAGFCPVYELHCHIPDHGGDGEVAAEDTLANGAAAVLDNKPADQPAGHQHDQQRQTDDPGSEAPSIDVHEPAIEPSSGTPHLGDLEAIV